MTGYIDPHIHMISRVTDDYQRMAQCGCAAVSEPAFWAGFDRGSAEGFRDYFRHLVEVEPKRAAQFNIRHYSWLCINAKEAENVRLSRDVIALIPEFIDRPNVLGIGEIGLNKNTRNEATVFQEHVNLAAKTDELMLIHTPHLEDKYKGTRMIVDMLRGDRRVNGRVDLTRADLDLPAFNATLRCRGTARRFVTAFFQGDQDAIKKIIETPFLFAGEKVFTQAAALENEMVVFSLAPVRYTSPKGTSLPQT